MASALASQLAQGASLNAALLSDRARRKRPESYLFVARETDAYDLESIYALGLNGFTQLQSLASDTFSSFEELLFSGAVKDLDRTLISRDENEHLNRSIGGFMRALGPYVMDAPAGKALEWLVRRFRINEFNIEDILMAFLPYSDTPHFAKMLSILHIQQQTPWAFLLPFKSAAKHVPRTAIVTEMLKTHDVARFLLDMLPCALREGYPHRVLIAFHTALHLEYITRCKVIGVEVAAMLLPALHEPLRDDLSSSSKDSVLSSYVLLAALSQKCNLAPDAIKVTLGAMAKGGVRVEARQLISSAVALCSPQEELEKLSDGVAKAFLRIPDFQVALRTAFGYSGGEKFVRPLLRTLASRLTDQNATSFLDTIICSPSSPNYALDCLARTFLPLSLTVKDPEAASALQRLLMQMYQRHPEQFSGAAEREAAGGEEMRRAVEELAMRLSTASLGGSDTEKLAANALVAATSADANARAAAVRKILTRLRATDSTPEEKHSLYDSIRARVSDPSPAVIDALYSEPQTVLSIFSPSSSLSPTSSFSFLSTVTSALTTHAHARPLLRLHLRFITHHFVPAYPSCAREALECLVWPTLLWSKPQKKSAAAVWEILGDDLAEVLVEGTVLAGCVGVVRGLDGKGSGEKSVQEMVVVNVAVAARIAENIVKSDEFSTYIDFIAYRLDDSDVHARGLAYLVAHALLSTLSGEHRVEAACKFVQRVTLKSGGDEGEFPKEEKEKSVSEDELASALVAKPSSRSTLRRLQLNLLLLVPSIPRPQNVQLDWLSHALPETKADTRGSGYVELMRTLYKLANAPSAFSNLSLSVIQALLISLAEDSLAFFAGIWTQPAPEAAGADHSTVATVALRHALAFLKAQPTSDRVVDFQTLVPALLFGAVSSDSRVRVAAVECIGAVAAMTVARKTSAIYAYDVFYGSTSTHLQYLDWSDFTRYLDILAQHREHIKKDASYLAILHQENLARAAGDGKKAIGFKQRTLCYLLSHVNSWSDPHAKIALLKTVEHVSDEVKLPMLLPAIQTYVLPYVKRDMDVAVSEDEDGHHAQLASLLLAVFDTASTKELNLADGEAWPVYIELMEAAFGSDSVSASCSIIAERLERGLFEKLSKERQVDVSTTVLTAGNKDATAAQRCKALLASVIRDVPLMLHLLLILRPSSPTTERSPKRAKKNEENKDTDTMASLTLYAEVLSNQALPASLELLASLLETLGLVTQRASSTAANFSYIQQLLMTACSSAAAGITMAPNANASPVRLDVLVEIIRVADNPRTVSQALLLVAELARLTPESVLHHVMPIFTFMGSNIFHRDDNFTFQVVQRTVDSIVPVMVSSLRSHHHQSLDLYIAASEFLHIFTDAANHIPRHRRTQFFIHLVDVLGPVEFLSPICMLLADKVSPRQARQTPGETFLLPLAVFTRYDATIQVSTIREILVEVGRLLTIMTTPGATDKSFFMPTPAGADEDRATVSLKRRAQILLSFVGQAMKRSSISVHHDSTMSTAVSDVISLMLTIVSKGRSSKAADVTEVGSAAQTAVNDALGAISATDFIHAVSSILESAESQIQLGALTTIIQRIELVNTETRQKLSGPIGSIIAAIRVLLLQSGNVPLVVGSLNALRVISLGEFSTEDSALAQTLPNLLQTLKNGEVIATGLSTLSALTKRLGPRVLPQFHEAVKICTQALRKPHHDETVHEHASDALQAFLTVIPSFWGSVELSRIIRIYLELAHSDHLLNVIKAVTKNIPATTLVPTLITVWPDLQAATHKAAIPRHIRFFDLAKRSLRIAPRPVVNEHIRPLFSLFVDAFGLERNDTEERLRLIIASFLQVVVKLNDASFQPLFRRLYDWAFVTELDDSAELEARQITFCRIYLALLDMFKALMTPYMSVVSGGMVELLQSFTKREKVNSSLWLHAIQIFTNSLVFDDGGFWHDDKLMMVAGPLVAQITICIESNISDGKRNLADCFVALVDAANDDTVLKKTNIDILMHTRSEDARVRLFALQCSDSIWEKHAGKLMGFVPETTTFIAECAEDENDSVVKEARKLKGTIEAVAGALEL